MTPPAPPVGLIQGTPYFAASVSKQAIKDWYAAMVVWKIKYGGWH